MKPSAPRRTKDCETCGNPIPAGASRCRFCESAQSSRGSRPLAEAVRTINVESGLPTVEEALRRLDAKMSVAISEGVRVVRVIHGYGSSGRGGAIRDACRRSLGAMLGRGLVRTIIRGEDYGSSRLATQDLLRRFTDLKSTERADGDNPGITMVEL